MTTPLLRPDGTMPPVLVPIEGMPARATENSLRTLVELHVEVAALESIDPDELHLTMALARPGAISPVDTELDDEWCEVVEAEVASSPDQGAACTCSTAARPCNCSPLVLAARDCTAVSSGSTVRA